MAQRTGAAKRPASIAKQVLRVWSHDPCGVSLFIYMNSILRCTRKQRFCTVHQELSTDQPTGTSHQPAPAAPGSDLTKVAHVHVRPPRSHQVVALEPGLVGQVPG